jgi:hypothetical protein
MIAQTGHARRKYTFSKKQRTKLFLRIYFGYMTMIGGHEKRKSLNREMKKPPMLFLDLCTDLDLETQKI